MKGRGEKVTDSWNFRGFVFGTFCLLSNIERFFHVLLWRPGFPPFNDRCMCGLDDLRRKEGEKAGSDVSSSGASEHGFLNTHGCFGIMHVGRFLASSFFLFSNIEFFFFFSRRV